MKTPVIIGIATIEARKESLVDTLESLGGQCDEIHIYQNGFSHYKGPDSFMDCYLYNSDMKYEDIGDAGKFNVHIEYGSDRSAYFLVCDDDLIYPPDYVETLIAGIERHDRKAVVGFHGKEYYGPVESYYRSFAGELETGRGKNYRCLDKVKPTVNRRDGYAFYTDHPATVIGTGCTGWHSSLFKDNPLSMDDFPHPNMADIWFSKKCNDLSIPRYVIPHEAGWIKHTDKIDMRETIASTAFNNDAIQTEVFNSVDWKL